MKSQKIEYIRFDDLNTGILIEGKPYLISYGDSGSFHQVTTPLGQEKLLKQLTEKFRYNIDRLNAAENSIKITSKAFSSTIIDTNRLHKECHHFELILNPSELSLIPFELFLNQNDHPLFVGKNDSPILVTRNFRDKKNSPKSIPLKPRVLFAHTKPDNGKFNDLPVHKHLNSLDYAMRFFSKDQLTVLDNPTFIKFKNCILKAIEEKNPFTHIHLLAHGDLIIDLNNPSDFEYGIAFNSDNVGLDYKATSNQEINDLFEAIPLQKLPYLVNYMICDGANFSNGIKAYKNPTQITFKNGVPIVIGSQFPLSEEGSNIVTDHLYKELFNGEDIRIILGTIRQKLYEQTDNAHDWISFVNYIELPEDYGLQLIKFKGVTQLDFLNTIRDKKSSFKTKGEILDAVYNINNSITSLSKNLSRIEKDISKESYFLEYSGLIASAYKRLAESEFIQSQLTDKDSLDKQKKLLSKALKWYKKAADRNQSHHWSVIQYISIKTVLDGELKGLDQYYYAAARLTTLTNIKNNKDLIWSYGSLIELQLLTPENDKNLTTSYVKAFLDACKNEENKEEYIKSTKYQLERYLNWWNSKDYNLPDGILASDKEYLKLTIIRLLEGFTS